MVLDIRLNWWYIWYFGGDCATACSKLLLSDCGEVTTFGEGVFGDWINARVVTWAELAPVPPLVGESTMVTELDVLAGDVAEPGDCRISQAGVICS